ncbi:glycosyltransferase [Rhodoplanes sp. TEM]|uniref:Glycosyltransferase n=1 Tax=Rhodoplanes tepidamans TaxID=200616 RepID=A0ABT5JKB8_RHOTP|nr:MULTISPECIES: glycosyltransferase [Rhodoplanes]MDC7789440.1 glycosyltransferase [Rhodoplanes tepidamans]MDC7985423.1 glycosyltransferase [Rhodoplanes sp. TEM]MDQ0353614.1 glycosyltransferase Alg8 [Rhodoplanes tepidamans]
MTPIANRKPPFLEKWNPKAVFGIAVYCAVAVVGLLSLPNQLWDEVYRHVVIVIGGLGLWRFGWWTTHAVRAWIFGRFVYPMMRATADRVWASGVRPNRVHFMMTTFRERPEITTDVVRSIVAEVRATALPATIWLGSGDASDEDLVAALVTREAADLDLDLVIARQDRPGKRYAIGIALRAMRRARVPADDVVVFMDGDAIIAPGMLAKCVPLFMADPDLQALTTDEEVVVHGPRWVALWLTMRFAQRRMAMQSHALAGKVLTLTGRLSMFRGNHVTRSEFITILEEDHLEHWLWGRFRFLSGDDKSTWYYMLRHGAKMTYVPDALSLTIEHIEGTGYERMVQNLRRWSGNMLRNGSRAIALGPRRVGFFIWWCVVDQRIAIWTMLVSPILAVLAAVFVTPAFAVTYVVWILITRLAQAMVLWCHSREVHLSYPLLLYVNQFVNAAVKVYCLFRLSKQRWTNRGDQKAGFSNGAVDTLRTAAAAYLTVVAMSALVLVIVAYSGVIHLPSAYTFASLTGVPWF